MPAATFAPARILSFSFFAVVACAASKSSTPPRAGDKAIASTLGTPRFAWKAPLTVHVLEDATKDLRTATLSYWLDVCPLDGERVLVAHRDFQFVTLMGKPASSPEFAPAIAELEPVVTAIPRLVVDSHGAVVEVEDVAELLARIETLFPGVTTLRENLETPGAFAVVAQAVVERWQLWVGGWLDVDPRSIAPRDRVGPARVKLSHRETLPDVPDPSGTGAKLSAEWLLAVDTQWPEIRPYSASSEKKVHVSLKGKSAERIETHRYRFAWDEASPRGPACPPDQPHGP